MYSKIKQGLSQEEAIENMQAVLSSDYFKDYDLKYGEFSSRLLKVRFENSSGIENGLELKVKDIAEPFGELLKNAGNYGVYAVSLDLRTTQEKIKAMNFKREVYREGLMLPLDVQVRRKTKAKGFEYVFKVFNLGLKESFFEANGLDYKDAKRKLGHWYSELTRNLNKILTHGVVDFSKSPELY